MNNEKGLTLVEILAFIVLAAIISVLAYNLLSSTNAEGAAQTKENRELQTVTYALKVVTKDVRQSIGANIVNDKRFTLVNALNVSDNVNYVYNESLKTLSRNSQIIAVNVELFEVIHTPVSITLKITNSKNESVETTLYYRKE